MMTVKRRVGGKRKNPTPPTTLYHHINKEVFAYPIEKYATHTAAEE